MNAPRCAVVVAVLLAALAPGGLARASEAWRMALPADQYDPPDNHRQLTPAASALCAAMRLPPGYPCSPDVILDAARQQTDPSLWIDRISSGSIGHKPLNCLDPILLETWPSHGPGTGLHVIGCHAHPGTDTVSPGTGQQFLSVVRRLQRLSPKTLRQRRLIDTLKAYVMSFEEANGIRPPASDEHETYRLIDEPDESGLRSSPGVPTAAALALCAAMRLAANQPCNADTILEAADRMTEPELQLTDAVTTHRPAPPGHCPRAVLIEVLPAGFTFGCYDTVPDAALTDELVGRLGSALALLQAAKPKTLAQHAAASDLPRMVEWVRSAVP